MAESILIVEDEPALRDTLSYNLKKDGFAVEAVGDGRSALESARRLKPDLIVLELMLPEIDGFEVCRILRKEMITPILMLTARDDEIDKVVGLEVGADDYLTKPFSMHELLARVKAQLRRAEMGGPPRDLPLRLAAGDLVVEVGPRRALRAGAELRLKPREFDLLAYFLRYPGQVLKRERLLRNVWGYEPAGDTRTVDVHVRWLRGKIESDPTNPLRLQTVRGVGYMFTG